MTTSEFASFVLAMLVALILFFGGQRALVELTDNEDFALPVQAVFDEPEAPEGSGTAIPTPPITTPEDVTTTPPESEAPEEPTTTTVPESEAPEDEPKSP
jgi:hypothetical protein